jgi:oligopeptide transport system permease protein
MNFYIMTLFPEMVMDVLNTSILKRAIDKGTIFAKLGANMLSMFFVFGLLYWVTMARLIRGQILAIKNNEYVLAAKAIGTPNGKILRRHILPNCLSVIIITTALQVPSAIFTESYLSFLGLGVSAPLTSLGSLANDARQAMQSYPYRLVIPAIIIVLIVLALNLIGDGLRDAFDSKLD